MARVFACLSLFTIQNIFSLTSDCNNGACTPLSTAEKQAILDIHNELRDRVAGGGLAAAGHPAATDMNYLIWDDGLQAVAQAYAESCPGLSHNGNRGIQYLAKRDSGDTKWGPDTQYLSNFCNGQNCIYTGENIAVYSAAYTIGSITSQIETEWWDEYQYWTFGIHNAAGSCQSGEQCGHYTQLAWANTRYIGCGYTNGCDSGGSASIFVCNYFPAGNFNSVPPYTSGTACSDCMSDRTECQSNYVSQPYNKLCDGGACPTMCDGASYNRNTCDGTGCTPSTIDCNDGTISKTAGRNICGTPSPTAGTSNPTTGTPTTSIPTAATPAPVAGPSNPDIYLCNYIWSQFNGAWQYVSNNEYTKNTGISGFTDPFVMKNSNAPNGASVWILDGTLSWIFAQCTQSEISSCSAGQWQYYTGSIWAVDADAYISSSACPATAQSNNKLEAPHSFKTIEQQTSDNKSYPLNMTEMHIILGVLILVLITMCGMIFGFCYYIKKNNKSEKQIGIAHENEMVYFESEHMDKHNTPTNENVNDWNQNQPSLKINVNGTATMVTKLPTTTPVSPLINLDQNYE